MVFFRTVFLLTAALGLLTGCPLKKNDSAGSCASPSGLLGGGASGFTGSSPSVVSDWTPPNCLPAGTLPININGSTIEGCGQVQLVGGGPNNKCGNVKAHPTMAKAVQTVISPCIQRSTGGCRSMKIVHWGFEGDANHKARRSCHNGAMAMDLAGVQCDGKYYSAAKSRAFFDSVRGCLGAEGLSTIYYENKDHQGHMHINMPGCNGGGRTVRGKGLGTAAGNGSVDCKSDSDKTPGQTAEPQAQ